MFPYQQPMQPMPQMNYFQQPQQNYMEVENIESIAMIQMHPNERRVYFDKHCDRFYTVETDAAGQKSIASYDFTKTVEKPPVEFVTMEQFNDWTARFEQFIQEQQPRNYSRQTASHATADTRSATAGIAGSGN